MFVLARPSHIQFLARLRRCQQALLGAAAPNLAPFLGDLICAAHAEALPSETLSCGTRSVDGAQAEECSAPLCFLSLQPSSESRDGTMGVWQVTRLRP